MRKLSIISGVIVILVFLFSISCFEERETIVTLGLGSPPANIVKIHIAVYDSEISPENAIVAASFDPSTKASITVPSGESRIFVVVAEDNTGVARRSDVSNPIDLEGSEISLNIDLSTDIDLSLTLVGSYPDRKWQFTNESQIGADTYVVWEATGFSNPYYEVYRGYSTIGYSGYTAYYYYQLRGYFSLFDLYTDTAGGEFPS